MAIKIGNFFVHVVQYFCDFLVNFVQYKILNNFEKSEFRSLLQFNLFIQQTYSRNVFYHLEKFLYYFFLFRIQRSRKPASEKFLRFNIPLSKFWLFNQIVPGTIKSHGTTVPNCPLGPMNLMGRLSKIVPKLLDSKILHSQS